MGSRLGVTRPPRRRGAWTGATLVPPGSRLQSTARRAPASRPLSTSERGSRGPRRQISSPTGPRVKVRSGVERESTVARSRRRGTTKDANRRRGNTMLEETVDERLARALALAHGSGSASPILKQHKIDDEFADRKLVAHDAYTTPRLPRSPEGYPRTRPYVDASVRPADGRAQPPCCPRGVPGRRFPG